MGWVNVGSESLPRTYGVEGGRVRSVRDPTRVGLRSPVSVKNWEDQVEGPASRFTHLHMSYTTIFIYIYIRGVYIYVYVCVCFPCRLYEYIYTYMSLHGESLVLFVTLHRIISFSYFLRKDTEVNTNHNLVKD